MWSLIKRHWHDLYQDKSADIRSRKAWPDFRLPIAELVHRSCHKDSRQVVVYALALYSALLEKHHEGYRLFLVKPLEKGNQDEIEVGVE